MKQIIIFLALVANFIVAVNMLGGSLTGDLPAMTGTGALLFGTYILLSAIGLPVWALAFFEGEL